MKLSLGKRLVLLVHWFLSLIASVALVFCCLSPETVRKAAKLVNTWLGARGTLIVGIAFVVLYGLFAAFSLAIILKAQKKDDESGFITVISDETGKTRIAVGAIDQMIRIAVRGVEGIADLKSRVINETESISIAVNVSVISGVHIPTVTGNIQRTISNYIELNCGVSVREVSVSVSALETPEEANKRGRKKFGKALAGAAPAAIEEVPAVKEEPAFAKEEAPAAAEEIPAEDEAYIPEVPEAEENVSPETEEA